MSPDPLANLRRITQVHEGRSGLGYIPALDGLRAIAVGGVLMFHALPNVITGGFLGVSSFFTLSGFLICTLLLSELAATDTVDLGAFWARRVKRLAPAALVVTVAAIVFTKTPWAGWGEGMQPSDGVAAALNVMNWHVIHLPADQVLRVLGPLGPYWSLGVEEQFYAVMLIVFLVLRRRPASAAGNLAALCVGTWVGSAALAIVLHRDHPREMFGTDVRAAELAAGCLLAIVIHQRGRAFLAAPSTTGRSIQIAGWIGLTITIVAFIWGDEDQRWVRAGGFAALSIVHVVVISATLAGGSMARVLASRPLVELGKLSYALYLVHWPIILSLRADRLHLDGGGLDTWLLTIIRISVSLAAAIALNRLVERPMRHHWSASNRTVIVTWIAGTAAVSLLAVALL